MLSKTWKERLHTPLVHANSVVNDLLKYAPEPVQREVNYLKFKARVQLLDYHLVEEEQLKPEYRRALRALLETRDATSIGDYLEFGIFYGSSLAMMHDVLAELGLDDVRLFGFDSFDGLPETASDDTSRWRPGQFSSSYRYAREYLTKSGVDWSRVILEKGWFSDTLTDAFRKKHRLEKASVIMVDCDVYSSAKEALDFCVPLICDEAIIFFDDWHTFRLDERNAGEKRAFDEFLDENPHFTAEEFGEYSYQGEPFAKIFRVRSGA